jgi:hypothetical protein
MKHSETIVAREGAFALVRVRYWGFRCQSLSTCWEIHKDGARVAQWTRMRDAKRNLAELNVPLRERLCTPMTIGEASAAASTVL